MKLYSNINHGTIFSQGSKITYVFIIWLVLLLFVSYLGFSQIPHSGKFPNNFLQSFANWDGGHFLGIAQFGYSEKFQYAFFPFYPLLINIVKQATGDYLAAGVLISVVSTFLGTIFLYKLVRIDFDKKIAEKAILSLLFFPTSFFFLAVYSEGLFFFLSVISFYFLRQNKIFWASVAAVFVSATRLAGLAVVIGLWLDVWTREGINKKNWYLIFAPLGFVTYSLFLYMQIGDPFYFITAEDHWQRILVLPGMAFWENLKNMPNGILDLVFAIFGLGITIRSFRFLPASFAIYSLVSVLIPLFTPTLSSIPRFLLPVFPIFIVVALVKNFYINLIFQIISISLLAIFAALFVSGYWVA